MCLAPGFGQALPYLEKSCGVGTDLEGARAELSGAGVAVGLQLPAWSSTGDRRTREEGASPRVYTLGYRMAPSGLGLRSAFLQARRKRLAPARAPARGEEEAGTYLGTYLARVHSFKGRGVLPPPAPLPFALGSASLTLPLPPFWPTT